MGLRWQFMSSLRGEHVWVQDPQISNVRSPPKAALASGAPSGRAKR